MMVLLSSLALAASTYSLPVVAQAGATQATQPASGEGATAGGADEGQICRTYRVTGSRTRREKVCMTAAQWAQHNENTRKQTGEMLGSDGVCSGGDCRGT